MKLNSIHPWNITETQASAIQKSLINWINQDEELATPLSCVARAQLLYDLDDQYSTAHVTLFNPNSLKIIERHSATQRLDFPATPGLLSFRKAPVVLKALSALKRTPELIICDGRGIIGPDRFGLASHIALFCNIPTIGWRSAPASLITQRMNRARGSWIPLGNKDRPHGALLRLHRDLPPIYVSHAHRITLRQALRCSLLTIPASLDNADMLELLTPEPIAKLSERIKIKEID